MQRNFRLRKSNDLERVRRSGKSYAHPLIVLIVHPNPLNKVRVGVVASRSVGGAVDRNRAKRRIREVVRRLMARILPGTDLLFLARRPLIEARHGDVQHTIEHLLRAARIYQQDAESPKPLDS